MSAGGVARGRRTMRAMTRTHEKPARKTVDDMSLPDPPVDLPPEGTLLDAEPKARPAPQVPSLGRIVIYTSNGEKSAVGEMHAAVITSVDAEFVSLRVWTRTAEFPAVAVLFTDAAPGSDEAQGRWAWPPRV